MKNNKKNKIRQNKQQQNFEEELRRQNTQNTVEFNDNIWVSNPRVPNQKNSQGRINRVTPRHNWNMLDYLGMVPFGVAATPLVLAGGEAAAGTAAGQAVTNFLLNTAGPALAKSKSLPWINAGLTSILGAPSAQKVVTGNINNADEAIEAGMMLSPLGQALRPMANAAKTTTKVVTNGSKKLANKLASDLKLKYYTHSLGDVPTGLRDFKRPLVAGSINRPLSGVEGYYPTGYQSDIIFNRVREAIGRNPTEDEIATFIANHPDIEYSANSLSQGNLRFFRANPFIQDNDARIRAVRQAEEDFLRQLRGKLNGGTTSVGARTLFNRLSQRFGHTPTMDEVEQFISQHPEVSIRGIQHNNGRSSTVFQTETPEQFAQVESDLWNTMGNKFDRTNFAGRQGIQLEAPPQQVTIQDPSVQVQTPQVQTPQVVSRPVEFRTRSAEDVEKLGRWRREDLFDSNGEPLFSPSQFDFLNTGAHGVMIAGTETSPEMAWKALSEVVFNPHKGRLELSRIRTDNPAGRSGVMIHSHSGDLSVDSHPLAHAMIPRLGFKEIIPISSSRGFNGIEYANNFGSVNLFKKQKDWIIGPELERFIKDNTRPRRIMDLTGNYTTVNEYNPWLVGDLPFDVSKLSDGSLVLSTPSKGRIGFVPARTAEDVLENSFNIPIRKTNERFKINLPEAELTSDPGLYPQFTFGRSIKFPIFGRGAIGLKKGGRLKLIKRNK